MVRAHSAFPRLTFLSLAGVLFASGCGTFRESDCQPRTGWFSHFHLTSKTKGSPCPCEGSMSMTSDGTMVVPPNASLPPNMVVPPGGMAPPPPTIINAPNGAQPPRIQPVPMSDPLPYTPTSNR